MAKFIQDRRTGLLLPKKQKGFFIPPPGMQAPYRDPYRANVSSLLHFIGANGSTTFTDETGKTWGGHGTSQISTTQAKFGTSSFKFTRNNTSWISTANSADYDFGNGNFTVEAFIYLTTQSTTASNWNNICCKDNITLAISARGWNLYVDGGSAGAMLFVASGGSTQYIVTIPAATITSWLNSWHHVAVVRNGATMTIYGDGVSINSTSVSGVTLNSINHEFVIGGMSTSASGVSPNGSPDGYCNDLRVTKGIARYTANFTPSTARFPNYGP